MAARRGRVPRSCVAAGSRSGGAAERAAPLPVSADDLPRRTERRGWGDIGPLSPRLFLPLSDKREKVCYVRFQEQISCMVVIVCDL